MKNFIFISPNFPESYWRFCAALQRRGFRVLGIGDCPYAELKPELKVALTEYYKVETLENYDEVYRAVAFFLPSTAGATGWRATTSIGWSGMHISGMTSISPRAFIRQTWRPSSSSPR